VPQTHFGGRSGRYGDRQSVQSWPATGVQFTAAANTDFNWDTIDLVERFQLARLDVEMGVTRPLAWIVLGLL
jgi:hypothetical protein